MTSVVLTPPGDLQLAYGPLPPAAYAAACDSVERRGFARDAILSDYDFSSRENIRTRVNALAFAHPVHRTPAEYAGISLFNAVNGAGDPAIVSVLAQSSAPLHLIHREERFSFWASQVRDGVVQPLRLATDIEYGQLAAVLEDYAVDLAPQRIVAVKQGRERFLHPALREVQPLQLSLWAMQVTRPLLVSYFTHAVSLLRQHGLSEALVTKWSTQLLGATILADTGVLGKEILARGTDLRLDELLLAARARFSSYFDDDLQRAADVENAYRWLRLISYAGFEPEMLTELYTAAYSTERRKELGRFDTPLHLTRRIWETIPVEFMPPEQRVVADMTCGWGSFLHAGHERLTQLPDMQSTHLRDVLHGNDIDRFTGQLARLGLLLATSTDSWQIDDGDALEWPWLAQHQPNIIVGNPPFGGDRKKPVPGMKTRHQKADQYLGRAIERLAPGGYVAMLMPHSFVAAQASPTLRRQLLEVCDVLELWDLPFGMFPDAQVATTVVFARKRSAGAVASGGPVRVRSLQAQGLETFKHANGFTASEVVSDQATWMAPVQQGHQRVPGKYIMDFHTVLSEAAWQRIHAVTLPLRDVADVLQGAIKKSSPDAAPLKDRPPSQDVPWFTRAGKVLRQSFFIDYSQAQTAKYPNEFHRAREEKEDIFKGTKVLLTALQDQSWGTRVKVGIERRGYYVSHNFWMIAPRPGDAFPYARSLSNEVIAAVLSWYVSNGWIVDHLKSPALSRRAIDTVPFPRNLTEQDCEILTEVVKAVENAAAEGRPPPVAQIRRLDDVLTHAYHLDDDTLSRLRTVAEWGVVQQNTVDPVSDGVAAEWAASGTVITVDPGHDAITFWLEGFDAPQTTRIAPAMPGWMLRPEASFRTFISRDAARERHLPRGQILPGPFTPQPYTYLDEQELLAEIARSLQEEKVVHDNGEQK